MDVNKLKAAIVENGLTQQDVAKILDITPKTFYLKMKKGTFGLDEAKIMIDKLNIKNPIEIFFGE